MFVASLSLFSNLLILFIPAFETICTMCVKIMSGKSLAQVDPDQGEEEESAEELAEMDSFLIGSCEDLISALASVLGADFAPTFGQFLPLISQYYVSRYTALSSR